MKNNLKVVAAKTHTAEYLLHKYWARKPHNVISYFLSELVAPGGIVLDPFCGSGVVLREAQKLGINGLGFDVNPIANKIASVLTNPPDLKTFIDSVEPILKSINLKTNKYYSDKNGKEIKYLIHNTIVECKSCHQLISSISAIKNGRKYTCPHCDNILRFNLENLVDSEITAICIDGEKELITDTNILSKQQFFSKTYIYNDNLDKYNFNFITNKRILAFDGMDTKALFTPRNYSILCEVASQFEKLSDTKVRDAALLLLTASVAQCSRLIPSRNNLSTGGPSWSVPGFWVPAQHLETNPLFHLRARLEKFSKGLKQLDVPHPTCDISVQKKDAISGIKELISSNKKVDLVFFDPPYGDNVPYLEFSSIWNSFIKDFPDIENDFSVSDRESKDIAWKKYNININNTLAHASKILNKDGHLLLTFNNNDIRAWEALLSSLQNNNFVCDFVTYQIPAVISSKAQFSIKGSYISDIYGIFSINKNCNISNSLSPVVNKLIKCATCRNGIIAKNLANRIIMIEWIKNNISSSLLKEKDSIIKSLFNESHDTLTLKMEVPENSFNLKDAVNSLAKNILQNGVCDWNELYTTIASEFSEYGFLDASELRMFLNDHVIFHNKKCISYV